MKPHLRVRFVNCLRVALLLALVAVFPALPAAAQPGAQVAGPDAPPVHIEGFGLNTAADGWLLAHQRLYRTADGGAGWQEITPPGLGERSIAAAAFPTAADGRLILLTADAAGLPSYGIATTSDGGATWDVRDLALFAPGSAESFAASASLNFIDPQHGWLVVRRATGGSWDLGTLFRTEDGGQTWARLALPAGEPVSFVDPLQGWTMGPAGSGTLYRTVDGGASWTPVTGEIGKVGNAAAPQGVPPLGGLPPAGPQGSVGRRYTLPRFNGKDGLLPAVVGEGAKTQIELYVTLDAGQTWRLAAAWGAGRDVPPGAALPVQAVGAGQWHVSVPNGPLLSVNPGAASAVAARVGLPAGLVRVEMAGTAGWAQTSFGQCQPGTTDCTTDEKLLASSDGGQTWARLALPIAAPRLGEEKQAPAQNAPQAAPAASQQTVGGNTTLYLGQGFDACTPATLPQLADWFTTSPYRAANLYIGGSALPSFCTRPTADYVTQGWQLGWKFIPTWSGPQSACFQYTDGSHGTMSNDPTTAYNQGVDEADWASDAAANIGLSAPGRGTVIYYDIEGYRNTGSDECRNAAKSFVAGWTSKMHARGNLAGVYGGTWGSYLSDFATIANVPDVVWPAEWYNTPSYRPGETVWDLIYNFPNTLFANHQRVYQYAGGHNETYGSSTLNIDCDTIDGVLAANVPPARWHVQYFSSATPTGTACYDGYEDTTYLFKDWGSAAPAAGCPASPYSALFTKQVTFDGGTYAFHFDHNDGVQLYVDGTKVLDTWSDGGLGNDYTRTLSGTHEIKIAYYNHNATGPAALQAWWRGSGALPAVPGVQKGVWRAQYFGNPKMWGVAPLVKNEVGPAIDHTWDAGPGYALPTNGWSAVYTTTAQLLCGHYDFTVHADDGVRLWVGGQKLLDEWRDQVDDFQAAVDLPSGPTPMRIEYYQNGGQAALDVSYQWSPSAACQYSSVYLPVTQR
jgi:photosystem II stability/assembly factor-like uncharacterized protein